ncbi:thiolase family protein [Muricauda sp. 334s03]|uniref:acetyl-CoA C-acyltransferase n=1 Tax=Flagellimonas yonaguniensis TaxID=3031325 RepID=A0ABT5XX12_9FLAO|nr:thiolase family protein [[Muricauda] yonaguniensis]MDF0715633.1 thiolase family protein [[Muricauda] yonaguniensis]
MSKTAYIIDGYRSPVGKSHKGAFKNMRSDDIAVQVVNHLLKEVPNIDPEQIDDLILGCAYPEAEQGMQMARLISLMALPMSVPGLTINRFCGSGLEAMAIAVQRIQSGMADVIIAGGTESMTLIAEGGTKFSPNPEMVQKHPDYFINMGLTAENVAAKYGISREHQDVFALESHKKAWRALVEHKFEDEIVPIIANGRKIDVDGNVKNISERIDQDEHFRPTTSLDALAKLKPAFKKGGTVTAGNSSPLSDGAAFTLIASEDFVKKHNLTPKARMLGYGATGVHPAFMGIGPVEAVPMVLGKAGLGLEDIDLYELNEAFAAQALAVIQELELDPEKVNVNGGAIALGHPLGATGTKLAIHLIHEMRRRNSKYGMVTACTAGGQGVAGIFENLQN